MRIAVNCQTLVKDKMEGLGWFTYESLKRITKAHPEHDFVFIFGKGIAAEFIFSDNVKAVNIGPPYFRPLTWLLKFEFILPRFVNRNNFDLYLSTDGWSSKKIKTKSVIVVHDINFVHFPEFLQKSFYYYYTYFFKRWVKHATRVVTVSQYSKSDIGVTYKKPLNEIDVAYNGSSTIYQPISDEERKLTQAEYTNNSPYFVFVGALHPRKNVKNLFIAFDKFKANDDKNIKLLIVGERFYWNKDTNQAFNSLKFKDDIIFAGRLSQEKLRMVLGAAIALTYVSLFEGFGIPLLEAMNCNLPIITSNTTSMPEIAGDAALIVNPKSTQEITDAMIKMANDESLRTRLIDAGKIRKNDFSWDKTASNLWAAVNKALQDN